MFQAANNTATHLHYQQQCSKPFTEDQWVRWQLSRVYTRATCCRQHVSCIGNKIVASLLPVCCCRIQRDTSRPWHKWIVIMLPRYSQHISQTSSLLQGNMCPSTYVFPDTSCSSANMLPWCKRRFRVQATTHRSTFVYVAEAETWTLLTSYTIAIITVASRRPT